jgi:hypothetical protein
VGISRRPRAGIETKERRGSGARGVVLSLGSGVGVEVAVVGVEVGVGVEVRVRVGVGVGVTDSAVSVVSADSVSLGDPEQATAAARRAASGTVRQSMAQR